ncbi:MAG: VOC family protein [Microthrixaceae bacterium]
MVPIARLSVIAFDCRDPHAVARFYSELTGWPVGRVDDDWIELTADGAVTLAFQLAPDHVAPQWPDGAHPQQAHVDLECDDLDVAEAAALAIGARRCSVQPNPDAWRVLLDPAGHPFCLVVPDDAR